MQFSESKIHKFNMELGRVPLYENILWFDIPMEVSLFVQRLECLGEFEQNRPNLGLGERPIFSFSNSSVKVNQISLHQLKDHYEKSLLKKVVEQLDERFLPSEFLQHSQLLVLGVAIGLVGMLHDFESTQLSCRIVQSLEYLAVATVAYPLYQFEPMHSTWNLFLILIIVSNLLYLNTPFHKIQTPALLETGGQGLNYDILGRSVGDD